MKTRIMILYLGWTLCTITCVVKADDQTNARTSRAISIVSLPTTSTQLDAEVRLASGTGTTPVRVYHEKVEVQPVVDQSRSTLDLVAIHDPKTHFVFWEVERSGETNVLSWIEAMWVVPDVGIIRVLPNMLGVEIEIYKEQAVEFGNWKKSMLGELAKRFSQGLTLPACTEYRVNMAESIGRDFFARPRDAAVPPPVTVLSVKHSATGWNIDLLSGVTTEKAEIELDGNFKVLRAVRHGSPK